MLPVGDEGGVDHLRPVVELPMEREPEAQGIRAGQVDLHPPRRIDIGQQSGRVDEVPNQRDLVQENIPET